MLNAMNTDRSKSRIRGVFARLGSKHFLILVLAVILASGFTRYEVAEAVVGEGTATIDGGSNATVVQSTSHKFTVLLTVGASGITADAENPTFTIPAGFTAPDATPVANAGLVVADGNWFVAGGATCVINSPSVGLTAASGQVITVDVTTACTVGPGGTLTLTYQGRSASAMGATALNIGTNDVISYVAVTPISSPPTITVTASSATLTVIKHVINNNGGGTSASAWNLTVSSSNLGTGTGSAVGSEVGTVYTLQSGKDYSVAESGGPTSGWYSASSSGDCTITSALAGTSYTCTLTSDDVAPQLTVTKTVVNNNGGSKVVSNFPLFIDGMSVTSGVASTTSAGAHTVSETTDVTYTPTIGGDCASNGTITLALGAVKNCTIINDDIGPQLTVTKTVVNNSGGTKVVSDFLLFLDGFSVTSGVASTTSAGAHTVSETTDLGYLPTIGGDCSANGTITLALGAVKNCTILNDDIHSGSQGLSGTINVVKTVINDSGGTKVVADFPLFVSGRPVASGMTNSFVAPFNAYIVTEISNANYVAVFSGDCDASGHISLVSGDNKICIVTNNDIGAPTIAVAPPLIDVVKVPSPLALPTGPGSVNYTYTLRNVGTIPVTNITMVGDSCSPLVFVSGDDNADKKLQLSEVWVYRCATTLSETHTNTVVATGWANGLSAVDIASATVVVGVPVVPPLIHLTKIPSPLALSLGGGTITYTERVTNPGTVPLRTIRVTDDKCSPVIYSSGDTNGNGELEPSEVWVYTCKARLTETTTNTAEALGDANGLTARDVAVATVVVASPGFPNTGFPPREENGIRDNFILALIPPLILLSYSFLKKLTEVTHS